LIFIVLAGCSNRHSEDLKSNPTIIAVFSKVEIEDLNKIMLFFNEQICSEEMSSNSNIAGCYLHLFERMSEVEVTGIIALNVPFTKQLDLYKHLNKSTFDEIWYLSKTPDIYSPNKDSIEYIHFQCLSPWFSLG
jgi:hypothetical protein